jgi:PAS domain S-box-containing protein
LVWSRQPTQSTSLKITHGRFDISLGCFPSGGPELSNHPSEVDVLLLQAKPSTQIVVDTTIEWIGAAAIWAKQESEMNESQDGIWIIDADSKTILANARMAEILGASPDEMLGQPSFSYVFAEDVAAAQRLFEAKSKGDSKPFHFRLRRKDGSEVWVDVQGSPLHNAAGEFNGIVGTFTISGSSNCDQPPWAARGCARPGE